MCNQTVGLVAAELERQGISTVAIQLLREVAEAVRPPRSLFVPYRHGFPLGRAADPSTQRAVLTAALAMLADPLATPGTIHAFAGPPEPGPIRPTDAFPPQPEPQG